MMESDRPGPEEEIVQKRLRQAGNYTAGQRVGLAQAELPDIHDPLPVTDDND